MGLYYTTMDISGIGYNFVWINNPTGYNYLITAHLFTTSTLSVCGINKSDENQYTLILNEPVTSDTLMTFEVVFAKFYSL